MMKMKPFQNLLKFWIAAGSLAAFMGGWIILGHSGKPVEPGLAVGDTSAAQLAPLPTLAPLASGSARSLQPLTQSPNTSFAQPRFRTRGS
jgi:hypothetical protein